MLEEEDIGCSHRLYLRQEAECETMKLLSNATRMIKEDCKKNSNPPQIYLL
jgi:hypothetical protein